MRLAVDVWKNLGAFTVDARFDCAGGITAFRQIRRRQDQYHPDDGRLNPSAAWAFEIDGQAVFDSAQGINVPPDRRRIGYVFQDARLFPI